MEAELAQLAASGANALISLMVSDGWGAVKERVGRLLRRGQPGTSTDASAEAEQLAESERLLRSSADGDALVSRSVRAGLEAQWTARLVGLLVEEPEAARELLRLLGAPDGGPRQYAAVSGQGAVYGPILQAASLSNVTVSTSIAAPVPMFVDGAPPPDGLPPATPYFTNREALVDRAVALACAEPGGPRILNLYGEGGIGKTAAAVRIALGARHCYPDGRVFADLRGASGDGAARPAEVLCTVLQDLRVPAQYAFGDLAVLRNRFRHVAAQLRVLVVLDDAASAAQVEPLLAGGLRCFTIVTSRRPLQALVSTHGAVALRVEPLAEDDAVALLGSVSGLRDEPAAAGSVAMLARGCAGSPLHLCVQGARLAIGRQGGAPDEAAQFEPVATPSLGGEQSADDAGLLDAYRDLPPEAARLHGLLAAQDWPTVTAGPAAAALERSEQEAAILLAQLHRARLLEPAFDAAGSGLRYRFHDRVRREAAAGALADLGPSAVAAATRRAIAWYLEFAVAADLVVMPGRWRLGRLYRLADRQPAYTDGAAALRALARERANLVRAVVAAEQYGYFDLVCQLCEALWSLFFRLGHHEDWIRVHRLGAAAAGELGDLPMEGRMHTQLAFGLMGLDRRDEAETELRAALAADQAAGHERGQATALESLGLLRLAHSEPAAAADFFAQAAELADRVGDARASALLEHHLGRALSAQGRHAQARERLTRALDRFGELQPPDAYNRTRVRMSLAEDLLASGRYGEAGPLLDEAVEYFERDPAVVQQAQVAVLRAWHAREAGDSVREQRFLAQAVE